MPYRKIKIPETTGQRIIQAVKKLAIEMVFNQYGDSCDIGQRSYHLSDHLIIYTGEKAGIKPDAVYCELTVESYNWGGNLRELDDQNEAKREIKSFARRLKAKLESKKKDWPLCHEVAIGLLKEDPERHLYTLTKLYAGKARVPAYAAKLLIDAFENSVPRKHSMGDAEYVLLEEAIQNLKRQSNRKPEWTYA